MEIIRQPSYSFMGISVRNGTTNFFNEDTTILLQIFDAKIVNKKNWHYVAKV